MPTRLLNNFHFKILAIIFAIFLWIFVINQGFRIDFLEKEITIQPYNLAEDLSLVSPLGNVKLKIRAPKSFWQEYSDSDIQAYVDLKHFGKGIYNIEVKVSSLNPQIQIIEKDPEKISVVIDSVTSIKKEIEVETKGSLAQDYSTEDPYAEPKEIEIKGAKRVLDEIDKVKAKVELSGESAEIRKKVVPEILDKDGNVISNIILEPSEIEVIIPIQKNTEVKTISVNSKITGSPAQGYSIDSIEVNPATVSVQGKKEDLVNISYIDTKEINIEGATQTLEKKAGLDFPANISSVNIKEVTIKINISSSIKTQSTEAKVNFENLDINLKIVSYTPSEVSITVEGKKEDIDKLKDNPVQCNISLQGKLRGTHTFTIDKDMISLPSSITLKSIDTKEVRVGLEKK